MFRPHVLAGLLVAAAGPAAAQDGPPERGPRIEMDLPGGKVEVDCGRTSISDCAAAIRPLVEIAIRAPQASGGLSAGSGPDGEDSDGRSTPGEGG